MYEIPKNKFKVFFLVMGFITLVNMAPLVLPWLTAFGPSVLLGSPEFLR